MKIFMDCDPGLDDALALFTLLGSPQAELLGISTVAGNVPVDKTYINARKLLALAGRKVPVGAGCDRPLAGKLRTAEHVHGADGLGGVALPDPPEIPLVDGVDLLIESLRGHPGATLLATGPLTNVATALRRAPTLRGAVSRIVVMGGSMGFGNVTPAAEFNFYVDPLAAHEVLTSGIPVTMVGLNVTETVTMDRTYLEKIADLGEPVLTLSKILDFYVRFHEKTQGSDRSALHDVVAAVEAVYPGTLDTKTYFVDVETRGELTEGACVVDVRDVLQKPKTVSVGLRIQDETVLRIITESMERLAKSNLMSP